MGSSDPMIHVWVTKYALTSGIFEVDARHCLETSDKMIEVKGEGAFSTAHYHKPDWHTSREDAVARACEMRDKKVSSMEKKLKRLRDMEF